MSVTIVLSALVANALVFIVPWWIGVKWNNLSRGWRIGLVIVGYCWFPLLYKLFSYLQINFIK